jgi:hypothetical protein
VPVPGAAALESPFALKQSAAIAVATTHFFPKNKVRIHTPGVFDTTGSSYLLSGQNGIAK